MVTCVERWWTNTLFVAFVRPKIGGPPQQSAKSIEMLLCMRIMITSCTWPEKLYNISPIVNISPTEMLITM